MYIVELNGEPHPILIRKFEFESNLIVVEPKQCEIVYMVGHSSFNKHLNLNNCNFNKKFALAAFAPNNLFNSS
jgi:hypothetical protein